MRKFSLVFLIIALLADFHHVQGQKIFAVTNFGDIHLIDPSNCQCQYVMKVSQVTTFDDIAWHGSRLYGLLQGGGTVPGRIFSVDTTAGTTTQIGSALNYSGNAMTSDQNGNLYFVHNISGGGNLYQYNITTGQDVMLGAVGETVGDLAFMNDTLYAVCFMSVLKRIVLNPFSVGVVGTISLPVSSPYLYGLATIEDGTGLCISALGPGMSGPQLYRLDHTNATGTILCSTLGLPQSHTINGLAYHPTYAGPPPSGIFSNSASDRFSLYPNPANEVLYLDFDARHFGSCTISVLTMQGKLILQQTIEVAGKETINTGGFPEGIYLLKVSGSGFEETRMFVRQ